MVLAALQRGRERDPRIHARWQRRGAARVARGGRFVATQQPHRQTRVTRSLPRDLASRGRPVSFLGRAPKGRQRSALELERGRTSVLVFDACSQLGARSGTPGSSDVATGKCLAPLALYMVKCYIVFSIAVSIVRLLTQTPSCARRIRVFALSPRPTTRPPPCFVRVVGLGGWCSAGRRARDGGDRQPTGSNGRESTRTRPERKAQSQRQMAVRDDIEGRGRQRCGGLSGA